jgi:hypothetical protein
MPHRCCSRPIHRRRSRSATIASQGQPAATRGCWRVEREGPTPPSSEGGHRRRPNATATAQGCAVDQPPSVPLGVEPCRHHHRRGGEEARRRRKTSIHSHHSLGSRHHRSGSIHHCLGLICRRTSSLRRRRSPYATGALDPAATKAVVPSLNSPHCWCSRSHHRRSPHAAVSLDLITADTPVSPLIPSKPPPGRHFSGCRRGRRPHATASKAPASPVV